MAPVHEFPTYLHSVELLRGENWKADEYPYSLPAVRGWDRLKLHPKVTFFVGENGSGKSTLVEAIATAWGLNPEGGSRLCTSHCAWCARRGGRRTRSFSVLSRSTHSLATQTMSAIAIAWADTRCTNCHTASLSPR